MTTRRPGDETTRTVQPDPRQGWVRDAEGAALQVPAGWALLPPGDALVTRKVKAGPHWVMVEQHRNKVFTRGVWAPGEAIAKATAAAAAQRARPEHARQLAASRTRRAREQDAYVVDFTRHVEAFLGFHPRHAALARAMAERVAAHATPVGSGTVARTERIPVAERAEAAVIAWMRHQTTAYDHMHIGRGKGERHEVRRALARASRELLQRYRDGLDPGPRCPLAKALSEREHEDENDNEDENENEDEDEDEDEDENEDEPRPEPAAVDVADARRARMEAVRARLARVSGPAGRSAPAGTRRPGSR